MRPTHFSSFTALDASSCARAEEPRGPWSRSSASPAGPACWLGSDDSLVRRWLLSSGASASTTPTTVWDDEHDEVGYRDEDYAVFPEEKIDDTGYDYLD